MVCPLFAIQKDEAKTKRGAKVCTIGKKAVTLQPLIKSTIGKSI